MNKKTTSLLVGLIALTIGGGAGYWFAGQRQTDTPMQMPMPMEQPPAAAEREVLFYRNPMNPQITSPVPGSSDLIASPRPARHCPSIKSPWLGSGFGIGFSHRSPKA